jgi:hypothetical protein
MQEAQLLYDDKWRRQRTFSFAIILSESPNELDLNYSPSTCWCSLEPIPAQQVCIHSMEVVAAMSSIVGILGFAGQAITGITRLNDFFLDCRSASKTADRFLKELESLKQAVEQVEGLLKALDHRDVSAVQGTFASLQIQLEDCKSDVDGWVAQAEKSRPSFGRGAKSAFKKFLVAVNKNSIKDVFTEIAVHRDNISLKLSIIGR